MGLHGGRREALEPANELLLKRTTIKPRLKVHGMVMYEALYRWCKVAREEIHTWNPEVYRQSPVYREANPS